MGVTVALIWEYCGQKNPHTRDLITSASLERKKKIESPKSYRPTRYTHLNFVGRIIYTRWRRGRHMRRLFGWLWRRPAKYLLNFPSFSFFFYCKEKPSGSIQGVLCSITRNNCCLISYFSIHLIFFSHFLVAMNLKETFPKCNVSSSQLKLFWMTSTLTCVASTYWAVNVYNVSPQKTEEDPELRLVSY